VKRLVSAFAGYRMQNQKISRYPADGRGNEYDFDGVLIASAPFPATLLLAHFHHQISAGELSPFDAPAPASGCPSALIIARLICTNYIKFILVIYSTYTYDITIMFCT
jgi:hypothetical protein